VLTDGRHGRRHHRPLAPSSTLATTRPRGDDTVRPGDGKVKFGQRNNRKLVDINPSE
jgi:hypothetical protein